MALNGLTDRQRRTLERFVVRARRVAIHSLARSTADLQELAQAQWHVSVPLRGKTVTISWEPPDEERFESLAARLRPFVLASESVHHVKVLRALRMAVRGSTDAHLLTQQIDELEGRWSAWDPTDLKLRAFEIQQADGNYENVRSIPDGTLAAGWLYADVVHADPSGGKEASLEFPLAERFRAAVPLFANLALVVLDTLDFIRILHDLHGLDIAATAWEGQVSVSPDDFAREATAYVAPLGTDIPILGEAGPLNARLVNAALVEEWMGARDVAVHFRGGGGEGQDVAGGRGRIIPASGEAGFTLRATSTLHFSVVPGDEGGAPIVTARFDTPASNEDLLDWLETHEVLARTSAIIVTDPISDEPLMTIGVSPTYSAEPGEDDKRRLAVVRDLVSIAERLDLDLPVLTEAPTYGAVRWLRVLRLGLEGWVVRVFADVMKVTSSGTEPPKVIVLPAHELRLGNLAIPFPQLILWHPNMACQAVGEAGVDTAEGYVMSVPEGEPFLAHFPEYLPPDAEGGGRVTALGLTAFGAPE